MIVAIVGFHRGCFYIYIYIHTYLFYWAISSFARFGIHENKFIIYINAKLILFWNSSNINYVWIISLFDKLIIVDEHHKLLVFLAFACTNNLQSRREFSIRILLRVFLRENHSLLSCKLLLNNFHCMYVDLIEQSIYDTYHQYVVFPYPNNF